MASDQPGQGVIRQRVLQLMAQKNNIEDEIGQLTGILTQVTPSTSIRKKIDSQLDSKGRTPFNVYHPEIPTASDDEEENFQDPSDISFAFRTTKHSAMDANDSQHSHTQIIPKEDRWKKLPPKSSHKKDHEHLSIRKVREHKEPRLSEDLFTFVSSSKHSDPDLSPKSSHDEDYEHPFTLKSSISRDAVVEAHDPEYLTYHKDREEKLSPKSSYKKNHKHPLIESSRHLVVEAHDPQDLTLHTQIIHNDRMENLLPKNSLKKDHEQSYTYKSSRHSVVEAQDPYYFPSHAQILHKGRGKELSQKCSHENDHEHFYVIKSSTASVVEAQEPQYFTSHTQTIPKNEWENFMPKNSHENDHEHPYTYWSSGHSVVVAQDPQYFTSHTQTIPKNEWENFMPRNSHETDHEHPYTYWSSGHSVVVAQDPQYFTSHTHKIYNDRMEALPPKTSHKNDYEHPYTTHPFGEAQNQEYLISQTQNIHEDKGKEKDHEHHFIETSGHLVVEAHDPQDFTLHTEIITIDSSEEELSPKSSHENNHEHPFTLNPSKNLVVVAQDPQYLTTNNQIIPKNEWDYLPPKNRPKKNPNTVRNLLMVPQYSTSATQHFITNNKTLPKNGEEEISPKNIIHKDRGKDLPSKSSPEKDHEHPCTEKSSGVKAQDPHKDKKKDLPLKPSLERDHKYHFSLKSTRQPFVKAQDPKNITSHNQTIRKGKRKDLPPKSSRKKDHERPQTSKSSVVEGQDPPSQCEELPCRKDHQHTINPRVRLIGTARKRYEHLVRKGLDKSEALKLALKPIYPFGTFPGGSKTSSPAVTINPILSKADQEIKLGIIHEDYPKEILSAEQLVGIQESIREHELKVDPQVQVKPTFCSVEPRSGWLFLVCQDKPTVEWVIREAHVIKPKGIPVKVVQTYDMPQCKLLMAHLPDSKEYSDKKILALLGSQNALDTLSWKVDKRITEKAGLELTIWVDERCNEELKNRGYKLSYKFGTIQLVQKYKDKRSHHRQDKMKDLREAAVSSSKRLKKQ